MGICLREIHGIGQQLRATGSAWAPQAAARLAAPRGRASATSTRLAAPWPGASAPGRAGTRRKARAPSWHIRKELGAKPPMSAAQQPVHYDILSLRVQRRQQGKAGAGAVCWCAAAALLAGFCECGARAETDPPAAVGAIPSPQLPPFPPRCLSVPCCLRSLPLVRLTFLPPASAAAVRRLGNGVLWGLRLSAPPRRCWCTTCAFNKRRLWWPLLQAAALRRLRKAQVC
jgi:hypothetical protein